MITQSTVSKSTKKLLAIIEDLQAHDHVQTVVLCTADGLPVYGQETTINHIAAVSGFLLSAAKQSSNMLGRHNCEEVTVQLSNDAILICHPFMAGETELILAILVDHQLAYKRMILQAISTIREAVET